ncbi:hypothetical protein BH09ACT12_BH09ACT12_37710 [soil metagenome]
MQPTSWSDQHDRVLRDAEPQVPAPSTGEIEQVWIQVAAAISGDESPRRRRRRRIRIGIAAGIGAVVLGTSGLAAAELYTARTGRGPVDQEDLRLGGPGERLHLGAPDYGEVVAEETQDIPFPSREARVFAVEDQIHDARGAGTDEGVSTGAVRAWVASAALCSWSNQWAAATRAGDEAGRTAAITMIQAAPTWPAIAAIDPTPYSRIETQEVRDEQGNVSAEHYRDTSPFHYLRALGAAVEGHDLDAVAGLLARNNGYCRPGNVPDLPQADPLHSVR